MTVMMNRRQGLSLSLSKAAGRGSEKQAERGRSSSVRLARAVCDLSVRSDPLHPMPLMIEFDRVCGSYIACNAIIYLVLDDSYSAAGQGFFAVPCSQTTLRSSTQTFPPVPN
eukprot:COSAG06_NODE_41656_length_389_cov_0.713793_1_plen_111_part_10